MNHMIRKQRHLALIVGVLVAVVVLGLWKLIWLVFDGSFAWAVGVGWVVAALLPFAIRFVNVSLPPPAERAAYRPHADQRPA